MEGSGEIPLKGDWTSGGEESLERKRRAIGAMLRLRAWLQAATGGVDRVEGAEGKCAVETETGSPTSVADRTVSLTGVKDGDGVGGVRESLGSVKVQAVEGVLSQVPGRGNAGYVGVDWDSRAQVMEGVGGSVTWYGNHAVAHPARKEILDAVFAELRPSVLRLRNCWRQGSDDDGDGAQTTTELMDEAAQIVSEALARLKGRDAPRILLCSWSPPAALKASARLRGADTEKGETQGDDVLRKDEFGVFVYREFAQFWLEALREYAKRDVVPTWIRCVPS